MYVYLTAFFIRLSILSDKVDEEYSVLLPSIIKMMNLLIYKYMVYLRKYIDMLCCTKHIIRTANNSDTLEYREY